MRALTPRTEDFDRTVVDLLTSPFVGYRRAVDAAVVQEVVGRMDHFEDASPELAIVILTDTAKVSQIEKAVQSHDEDRVEEAVRIACSTTAREWQEAVVASDRRLKEIEKELADAESRVAEAEVGRVQEREEADRRHGEQSRAQREQWETERAVLQEKIDIAQEERDDALRRAGTSEGRITALEERLATDDKNRDRNRRIALGGVIVAVGIALALILSLLVFTDKWAIGATAVGGAGLALIAIRIAVGEKHGREVTSWGGLLLAIAAIVIGILIQGDQTK